MSPRRSSTCHLSLSDSRLILRDGTVSQRCSHLSFIPFQIGSQRQSSGWIDAVHSVERVHLLHHMGDALGPFAGLICLFVPDIDFSAVLPLVQFNPSFFPSTRMGGQTSCIHPGSRSYSYWRLPWVNHDQRKTKEGSTGKAQNGIETPLHLHLQFYLNFYTLHKSLVTFISLPFATVHPQSTYHNHLFFLIRLSVSFPLPRVPLQSGPRN